MSEEIEKVQGESIQIPDIGSSRQAIILLWSAMSFLLTNYKKTTLAVILVLIFMIRQFITDYSDIQSALKMFGL
jgi:hypothetical protein